MGGHTNHGIQYYLCRKSLSFRAPINEKGEPQPCTCKWVKGSLLEAAVWDTIANLLKQPELLIKELEHIAKPDSSTRETLEVELAQVRKRLSELPNEERRLIEGYRKGYYPDFMMKEETDRLRRDSFEAEKRLHELEMQIGRLDKALKYKKQIGNLTRRLSQGLENMTFTEKRELLRLLVDEIIYEDGNLRIKTIIPLDERQLHPADQRVRVRGIMGYPRSLFPIS
jgi:site-specific DNA recombinase